MSCIVLGLDPTQFVLRSVLVVEQQIKAARCCRTKICGARRNGGEAFEICRMDAARRRGRFGPL
jgi:hypothetical protein